MAENQKISALGVPRDEFLDHVRRSLGRSGGGEPAVPYHRLTENLADLEAQAASTRARLEEQRVPLADRFAETARLRSWNLFRAASPEEAIGYVAELATSQAVSQIARSDQPVFHDLPLDSALEALGVTSTVISHDEGKSRSYLRNHIIGSGIGITGADYAVAETGSVVVLPRKGLSRLVSLVPPVHVAIVRPRDIVESLDDVFLFRRLEYHRTGGAMGSYLNFITGPSRTADIEMKLVVGVHGPREVHLVLLG